MDPRTGLPFEDLKSLCATCEGCHWLYTCNEFQDVSGAGTVMTVTLCYSCFGWSRPFLGWVNELEVGLKNSCGHDTGGICECHVVMTQEESKKNRRPEELYHREFFC